MEPARQIFWNIESRSFLTAWGLLVALSLLAAILLRLPSWKQGRTRLKPQATRGSVLRTVLTFKGIRLGHLPVRMHRCMFYGFILLGVATVLVGLQEHVGLPSFGGVFTWASSWLWMRPDWSCSSVWGSPPIYAISSGRGGLRAA